MRNDGNTILVITAAHDATATYVCDRMSARGIDHVRFDTERFPQDWTIHWPITPRERPTLSHSTGAVIDLGATGAVWYRRPAPAGISEEITEPSAREFARRECDDALAAVWQHSEDLLWVNHPREIRYAARKPHQLRTASTLGLAVPETIFSGDEQRVRAFWERHGGNVVFKTLHQDAIQIGGENFFAYATRLTKEQLPELSRLALTPTLFQQYIAPKLELRVTVFGERVFSACLDTSGYDGNPDWRRREPERQAWEPTSLPTAIEAQCVALIKRYRLNFGAIDLILGKDDVYYFLDLNANGQWVWIELITGMTMSDVLITLLQGHA